MRTVPARRLLRLTLSASILALGSCGEAVETSQAEPFVGTAEQPGTPAAAEVQRKGGLGAAPKVVGDADGWAFSYRERPATGPATARLDLRPYNEPVAGQAGFVRLAPDGNSFVLGSGIPARFWAINSDVFRQAPEAIEANVRFLARIGVNMVRLHAQINPKDPNARATDVDEKELDGIWRYVAAAKAQGIYLTISPWWSHSGASPKLGIEGYTSGGLEGLLFFEEAMQAAYKAWTRALLTRPNPYTGVPIADDPAVAILQVHNEDSLLWWSVGSLKPGSKAKLAAQFSRWVVAKYGSSAAATRAWEGAPWAGDDSSGGKFGLIDLWQLTQRQPGGFGRRVGDQLAFFGQTQRRFYEGIAAYFRDELHCHQLINASNWRTADDVTLEDVERWSYAGSEVIAANRYYNGGIHLGPNAGWRIDPGDKFSQKAGVSDPRALPFNLKQVVGRPMIVTESSWVAPIAFAAEGPFLAAAYTALTGVDAFYWFNDGVVDFDQNPFFPYQKVQGQEPLLKWTAMTPTIAGGFPAAAILFRGGYVRQGKPVVHEERTLAALWDREDPIIAEGPTFDPNRDPGGPASPARALGLKGADPLAFLVGPVEVKYEGEPANTRLASELPRLIDPKAQVIRSITGEVILDYGKGICSVDAPKAQGACGFLGQGGPIKLADLSIRSANSFAAVLAVPLDDQPLAASKKVLVQVTTAARPTGWAATPVEFAEAPNKPKIRGLEITRTGRSPWRVANTEVGLALKNPHLTKAARLDPAGYPVEVVPVTRTRTGLTLTLPPETMYLVLESD